MAAYRYWKLLIPSVRNGTFCAITSLVFAETPGGPNIARGGTASASSVYSTYTPSDAFNDDNSLAGWVSGSAYRITSGGGYAGAAEWIQYDLGAGNAKEVREVSIFVSGVSPYLANYIPTGAILYASNDAVEWVVRRIWGGLSMAEGATHSLDATPLPPSSIRNRLLAGKTYRRNEAAAHQDEMSATADRYPSFFFGGSAVRPVVKTPYSGSKRIVGSTTVLGMPAARRVHLLAQSGGLIIDTRNTGDDGRFEFNSLAPGTYTVLGVDQAGTQNSVVYAHVEATD